MLFLKKLITPFILPPGLLIAVLLAAGIWSVFKKNRWAAGLCSGVGIALWLASSAPVADQLIRPLETAYPLPRSPRADVIIMLGGGSYPNAPDFSGIGVPSAGTLERMVTAARLSRHLDVPIIVSGGKLLPSDTPVAIITERFLIDLGIPQQQIILEHQSRDTYENAVFSKKICDQYGFNQPLLVTSGYHLKRAVFCFEKAGLPVTPYPCALTTWKEKEYDWRHALPDARNLSRTATALHERMGLMYYRMAY